MSQADAETTATPDNGATPLATSIPAPVLAATPPVDVEKLVKKAKLEGYREAQAAADKRQAREMKAQADAQKARQRLEGAGVRDSAVLDDYTVVAQKARRWEEAEAEMNEYQAGVAKAAEIAQTFGVDPSDPRIQNTDSWDEYTAKVKTAATADLRAEQARLVVEAEALKTKAVDAQIESGALDVLGASPAGSASLLNLEKEYRQRVLPLRGNTMAIMQLKKEFRNKGLKTI